MLRYSFWVWLKSSCFCKITWVYFNFFLSVYYLQLESIWNVMAHGDPQEGKWRGNWWMEWVASTRHTTSEHGVSSITTACAHTSAACSRLNWHPQRFKWTCPFRRKTKSGFWACAITFQTQSTNVWHECRVFSSDWMISFVFAIPTVT